MVCQGFSKGYKVKGRVNTGSSCRNIDPKQEIEDAFLEQNEGQITTIRFLTSHYFNFVL